MPCLCRTLFYPALPLPYSTERNYTIAELCFTSRSRTMRNDTRPLLCLAWHRCTPPCHRVTALNSAERHVALLYHCHATPYGTLPLPLHSTLLYNAIAMPRLASLHPAKPLRYCAKHCGTPRCSALPLPYSALPRLAIAEQDIAKLHIAIATPCIAVQSHCYTSPAMLRDTLPLPSFALLGRAIAACFF